MKYTITIEHNNRRMMEVFTSLSDAMGALHLILTAIGFSQADDL